MNRKILPWPDVTGAKNREGHPCVGSTRSGSKHCCTRLEFYQPGPNRPHRYRHYLTLANDVRWLPRDHRTIAILTVGLRDIVDQKIKTLHPTRAIGFCGTGVTTQLNNDGLFLYEAGGHGTIYPRFRWVFPYNPLGENYAEVLARAIIWETLRPDVLVGMLDRRLGVSLPPAPDIPTPRFDGDMMGWLDEYLAQRET